MYKMDFVKIINLLNWQIDKLLFQENVCKTKGIDYTDYEKSRKDKERILRRMEVLYMHSRL